MAASASGIEEIVRRRLDRMIRLRPERILAYEMQDEPYSYRPQYLEIDAVSGSIENELRLFEIKATRCSRESQAGIRARRGHRRDAGRSPPLTSQSESIIILIRCV